MKKSKTLYKGMYSLEYIFTLIKEKNLEPYFDQSDLVRFFSEFEDKVRKYLFTSIELFSILQLYIFIKPIPLLTDEFLPENARKEINTAAFWYKMSEFARKLGIKIDKEKYFKSLVLRVYADLDILKIVDKPIPFIKRDKYLQYILDFLYYHNYVSKGRLNEYYSKIEKRKYIVNYNNISFLRKKEDEDLWN
ncbi:MAG: hypothetical protein GYA51_03000 [Candidatus Methanofastidiosa archaeon]|nr:hypothetical protein [Candidatus Methanofastidiosa archaeon]